MQTSDHLRIAFTNLITTTLTAAVTIALFGTAQAATYTYSALIKSFDTPPELGGLEYRSTSGAPSINNRLEAAGTVHLVPDAPSGVGFRLLRFDRTRFSTLVSSGTDVPGAPGATIDLLRTNPIVSQNGDILFSSTLSRAGATFPADDGLFRLSGSTLETLVWAGDIVDGVEIGPFSIGGNSGAISPSGQVAFQATFDDGTSDKFGLFREEAGGFSLAVQ
ncbi:MAG: hypothetical protein AAF526_06710 [Pseudomonadota bacterium]